MLFGYVHGGCSNLRFKFYFDANSNCIKDAVEPFNSASMLVEVDSAGIPVDTISGTSGINYKAYGPPGTVYAFRVLPGLGYYASCPSTATIYDTIATVGSYPIKYFGLSCTGGSVYDLEVLASTSVSAANMLTGNIYVRNNYCYPTPATINFNYNPLYTSVSSVAPALFSSAPGTLTWNLSGTALNTGLSSFYFQLRASTGGYLTVGSLISERADVSPVIFDADTSNNHIIIIDTVTGPYDPNMIEVVPSGCFMADTQLFRYTINFENTGNDTAHNIHVMDTLSDNLDPRTLKVLLASHDMDVSVYRDGVYTIANFDFPGINLLDSSHHGFCDGSVFFTVNVRPGLAYGTTITNRAGIYFDYADVVMTNTVTNIKGCGGVLGAGQPGNQRIDLFPNPTTGELSVSAPFDIEEITVTNLVGQTVYSNNFHSNRVKIDVSNLSQGIYLVKINGSEVRKFIKK